MRTEYESTGGLGIGCRNMPRRPLSPAILGAWIGVAVLVVWVPLWLLWQLAKWLFG